MKCIVYLTFFCFSFWAEASDFSSTDRQVKEYIINIISDAIHDEIVIAVIHSRLDESFRPDFVMTPKIKSVLGVKEFRLVTFLKGGEEGNDYGLIYIYPPRKQTVLLPTVRGVNNSDKLSPYNPSLLRGDDLIRLVFMRKVESLKKERLENYSRGQKIYDDAVKLDGFEFLKTYKLDAVFENYVYESIDDCIFKLHYDVPKIPDTKAIELNKKNLKLMEGRTPEVQDLSRLIKLDRQEVSELIFISYLSDPDANIGDYKMRCLKNKKYIDIVDADNIKTELGKSLFLRLDKD